MYIYIVYMIMKIILYITLFNKKEPNTKPFTPFTACFVIFPSLLHKS